jgi:hypothetical protein
MAAERAPVQGLGMFAHRGLSLTVGLALLVTSCAAVGGRGDVTPGSTPEVLIGPLTPRDPGRISAADVAAIRQLGASSAGVPTSAHDHGHADSGVEPEYPLLNGDAETFADQWLRAVASVPNYNTVAKATALGYVRASTPSAGVGTHYVLWPQIAKPFDPAHPAMLLFDERKQPAVLVGFSYWVQSATEPEGFAGYNDHWHQHTGLCVVNGWVDREEASSPSACAGTYLAGGDLWMLHAWVVPAYRNRNGRFANTNLALCPPKYGTPDILRCPGT